MKIDFSCLNPSTDPPISGFMGGDLSPTVAGIGFRAGSGGSDGLVGFRVCLDIPNCKEVWVEALNRAGVLAASEWRSTENIFYLEDI